MNASIVPDLILHNGRIATLDPKYPEASNLAIKDGRIVGVDEAEEYQRGPNTKVIDLHGRRVIPGLNDSHLHVIRGGLNYNMELRWDGVPSLADGLRMLKEQAQRTPTGQWVRVVGGWTEFQFAERRMPTLDEINAAAPNTPVFILHLYCRALLNQAALRACGYTKDTPNPPGGEIQHDQKGNPTGLLIARPNATILYATLAKGPKLPPEHQMNSTRHFMRELNRLGLTSVIDAGGGFQNYPEDYAVIDELHKRGEMTVRIAYNLFTQKPKQEKDDFARWIKMTGPGKGDDFFRCNGAGEMLVFSAADFEDFLEPRPDLPASLESELKEVVSLLAVNKWPFRLHATYDESISRFLNVFEEVNRDIPFQGLNWFFDHCETVTDRNLERIKTLGGGIAIQHRMAYQGEYFMERYGQQAAERTPPVRKMLELGLPVGAGTDATRVASYNPWVSLYWMVTGKTVGGVSMYPEKNLLSRQEALQLYTQGSSWFSSESGKKGAMAAGQLADLVALTEDFFSVAEEKIKGIESVLTIVGGQIVHATNEFAAHTPPAIPVLPEWSPAKYFGGYGAPIGHSPRGASWRARAPTPTQRGLPSSRVRARLASTPVLGRVGPESVRRILGNGLRLLRLLSKENENMRTMKKSNNKTDQDSIMYETENDLELSTRSALIVLMNQRLADAVDLQAQMKQAHWNVKGPHFIGLHELFDQIDEAVESYVDLIAERVVQLGGIAEGTVRVAAARSRLEEYPLTIADGSAHVEAVAKALSTFGHDARNTIDEADGLGDADTADIFTEISRGIDKWLWFVEAHTQAAK